MIDADDPGAGDADQEEGYASLQVKIKGLEGAKQITMNTNALEIKINAIQILKNLARNMEVHMFEYVEEIAKLCLEKCLTDKFTQTVRKESGKLMRFLIAACKEHPDKQRTLYIMTYAILIEELEARIKRKEFDQVVAILKELSKQIRLFSGFKDKGISIYSVEDAQTYLNKLKSIVELINADKIERIQKVKKMGKKVDQEDMEYFLEDLEDIDKGIHHVMEICGSLMQNMGD